jgi:Tfp pilus assembly protein PilV
MNNSKGMVLVEALLAIVILSVGITVVVQALSASRRNVAYSLDFTKALFILENEITKASIHSGGLTDSENTIQNDQREYNFHVSPETMKGSESPNLKEFKAELTWKTGSKDNALVINTYTFTPPHDTEN